LFLVNHDSAGRGAAVTVDVPRGTYAMTELVNGATRTLRADGGVLRLNVDVGGRDAQVWSIKRE
jgi:hypothetical protein